MDTIIELFYAYSESGAAAATPEEEARKDEFYKAIDSLDREQLYEVEHAAMAMTADCEKRCFVAGFRYAMRIMAECAPEKAAVIA